MVERSAQAHRSQRPHGRDRGAMALARRVLLGAVHHRAEDQLCGNALARLAAVLAADRMGERAVPADTVQLRQLFVPAARLTLCQRLLEFPQGGVDLDDLLSVAWLSDGLCDCT